MMATRLRIDRGGLFTWSWQVALLAAGFLAAGAAGLQLAHYREGATLVWPGTGLALAALLLFGVRLWPGIFIATALMSFGSSSISLAAGLGVATANTLEAVIGTTILMRLANFRPSFARMQDGVAFLLIGVLGCTAIGATLGATTYYAFGLVSAENTGRLWLTWWLGDLGGALILTPMLLMLVHGTPSWTSLVRRIESWLAFGVLLATAFFAFFGPDFGLLGFAASVLPIPVLVWIGTRLGPRGVTTACFTIVVIATIATASDSGPFTQGTPNEAIFLLWAWAMLVGITSFTLATVIEQRNFADRQRELEETERNRAEKKASILLERERLTREMHDGLGGQIVSVLAMVERGMAPRAEIAEAIRRAIDDIRIIIDSLDPAPTDLPASLGRLRARLEPLLRRNEITLAWEVGPDILTDVLSPQDVLHVSRIIQEAVTNTLRHAHANKLSIAVSLGDGPHEQLRVSIRDDGHGVAPDRAIDGRGTRNMKKRAEELGAEISIEDSDAGTQIDLVLPLGSGSEIKGTRDSGS